MPANQKIRWHQLVGDLAKITSQTELGRSLGVTSKEVSRWVAATSIPQGHNAQKLLDESKRRMVNWKKYAEASPVYDLHLDFDQNAKDGPNNIPPYEGHIPTISTTFLGHKLNSPLGLPASVLTLDSTWISQLARCGYDTLTYKTVRTTRMLAHAAPNVAYLPDLTDPLPLNGQERKTSTRGSSHQPAELLSQTSLANSFGMPSSDPSEWQADVQKAIASLQSGQILIVSVVGTASPGPDLISDFVRCAKLASETHPHGIELNFSCPNVYDKQEGSIYKHPEIAGEIVARVRRALPDTRVLAKIGFLRGDELERLFTSTYKYVDGYTAINTLPLQIVAQGQRDQPYFGSKREKAGISGVAIRKLALQTITELNELRQRLGKPELGLIGVGGVSEANHVTDLRSAGADVVQLCTSVILDPGVGIEIRGRLARDGYGQAHARSLGTQSPAFSDPTVALAFDLAIEVARERHLELDHVMMGLTKEWIGPYQQALRELQPGGRSSSIRTRRHPPTKDDIEKWALREKTKITQK
jgi:dihydroorotate dehydrogenase (NAD+) catalytic subunit